jgi:hypothetical protein
MVEIFSIKLVQNGVQHHGLLVNCDHRVCRYCDPVVYDEC